MAEAPSEHAAATQAALRTIVAEHGARTLSDERAMTGLLRDLLPDAPREVSILVAAAREELADSLQDYLAQGMDAETAGRLIASSFAAKSMFPPDTCAWVVGQIATALGLSAGDGERRGTDQRWYPSSGQTAPAPPPATTNGAIAMEAPVGQPAADTPISPADEPGVAPRRRPIALATLCMVLFLTFVDITIVSVALAGIHTQLNTSVSSLQWVVGAYALTFASTMLVFGTVGDQFGRKKVMLIGVCVYCAGALMCVLSVTLATKHHGGVTTLDKSLALAILLAGRAVMGFGAAASEPGTLSMLRHLYPEYRSRNRALGVWAAVSGFSLALGPVFGGLLVYFSNWQAIFWFDVAFGLAALTAGIVVLPENADPDAGRLDISGAVFGATALATMIFAVMQAENSGYGSATVIALLCVSAASLAAFLWRESRATHPLLDLRFLHVPRFATPNVVAFCTYFATFALFSFTALFLQEVSGYDGGQIAKVFVPMTVLMILASLLAGRWTGVVGIRWSIVAGCAAFAGGLLWTSAVLSPNPPYLPLAAALALTGIGMGTCVVPITSSVLAVVPPERSGMAASTTNTSREVGTAMGVAVLGALTISRLITALVAGLNHLGIPAHFQNIVITGVLTGMVPSNGSSSSQAPPGTGKLVQEVIQSAYAAFESGLHLALYVSAALVAAAGLLAAITLRAGSETTPSI